MSWLKKLSSLIKKLQLFNNITANSHNTNTTNNYTDNRKIEINVNLGSGDIKPSDLADVTKVIKEGIKEEKKFLITSESAKKKLKLIDDFHLKNNDSELIQFIYKNIPTKDRAIWYSSLILKQHFAKGEQEEVARIKTDIVINHPIRGRNIANLCNSDYLESLIIPVYEYHEKNNDVQGFLDIYETIVIEYPFAVFASHLKSKDELKTEILDKISSVRKYGWEKVNVHGIGHENVKKIMEATGEIEKILEKKVDVSIDKGDNKIIKVVFKLAELE